jgi:hypothetical protein
MNDKMVNGVVGGAVVEVDRRESESKGCDVFYPSTLFIPSVWLPQVSTRTCCGASIEVATVLPPQWLRSLENLKLSVATAAS